MKVTLKPGSRQAQCVRCERIFTSDAACEKHKSYATPKTTDCKDPATLGMVEGERGWKVPIPEDAQWWTGEAPARKETQELTCRACGLVWERPAQRGRPPVQCAACKAKES